MTDSLVTLEREVEQARAKLATDLASLRSPRPYRQLATDVKSEAQSVGRRILDDLKARAAANPAATLAIGAGIAWKFLKDPPIATALIGAGVLSLWRTERRGISEGDYLSTAQERFVEQASRAADTVKDYATKTVTAAGERASTYAHAARETVDELARSVANETAESIDIARDAAKHISDKAVDAAQHAKSTVFEAVRDEGVRDRLLLGVAGLAVVAALGIAYHERANSEVAVA